MWCVKSIFEFVKQLNDNQERILENMNEHRPDKSDQRAVPRARFYPKSVPMGDQCCWEIFQPLERWTSDWLCAVHVYKKIASN